jgi:TRAP-type C4-dicarboxylate transport system permease small subunit
MTDALRWIVPPARFALSAARLLATVWVVACVVVMTVAVWAQVGGRYAFNYSISWTDEVATIAQIWMVLVGAGIAARHQLHARVDVLLALMPLAARRVVMLATLALGLWFLFAIVEGALALMAVGRFQTTPALGLPMIVPYAGLVVGPVYFAIEMVAMTVAAWNERPEAGDSALGL